MKCRTCGSEDTAVVDSRPTRHGTIRRRRQCLGCQARFSTLELWLPEGVPTQEVRDAIQGLFQVFESLTEKFQESDPPPETF